MVILRPAAARSLTLALLAIAGPLSSWAGAQTVFNWDGLAAGGDGFFSAFFNWTPAVGPPEATEEARFNSPDSAYTVSFTTDPTNAQMRVGNDHVTFNLGGHTYTLTTSTSSPSIMVGGLTFFDDALLTIRDGTLAGQHAVIAPAAAFQTAAGMVVDTGGTLDLAGTFTVGMQLPGSLVVQNGGDVTSATGVLGESGNGNGIVTVTGAGSTWHNSGSVYVGGQAAIDGGNGTLSITNQGLVDVGGTLKLWPGGNVALNGGRLDTTILELAGGSFNWISGTLHLGSDLSVDPLGPLGGSVAVGAGKVLDVDGLLSVGNSGDGTMEVTNGAMINSFKGAIGASAGSTGHVLVSGSSWSMYRPFNPERFYVGDAGHGELEIAGAAQVRADGTYCIIGNTVGATGNVMIDGVGSSLQTVVKAGLPFPFSDLPAGIVIGNFGTGTLRISNNGRAQQLAGFSVNEELVESWVGRGAGSHGTVIIDDGSWSLTNVLYIGYLGEGTVEITNGGSAAGVGGPFTGYVGWGEGSTGSLSVDGVGSRWSSDTLYVGWLGSGVLSVTNGGTVQVQSLVMGALGEVSGNGNIVGDVENGGLVSPGTSPGALNIDGNYTQTANGKVLIELASASSYDQLLVTGEATLAGTLQVSLLGGFTPSPGQSFTLLTSDDVDGTFATELLPSVPGRIFDVVYNPTSVVLTVSPAFTADFDEDGDVDADDLAQWQGDFGVNALSDADNDGDSDGDDFLQWQRQLGSPGGAVVSSVAIPEPASAGLMFTAAVGIAVGTCRRRGLT